MPVLPTKIIERIALILAEDNPMEDVYHARLVSKAFETAVTKAWVSSNRLEKESLRHFHVPVYKTRLRLCSDRLREAYLRHKLNKHEESETRFASWMKTMVKSEGANGEARHVLTGKLLEAIARGNTFELRDSIPMHIIHSLKSQGRYHDHREPLEQTARILQANQALTGNAEDLDRLLSQGHDFTSTSSRFGIESMAVMGTVANDDIVDVLVQNQAPFVFDGLRYGMDGYYFVPAIASESEEEFDELLQSLKNNFPGAVRGLLKSAVSIAEATGQDEILPALKDAYHRERQVRRRCNWPETWDIYDFQAALDGWFVHGRQTASF